MIKFYKTTKQMKAPIVFFIFLSVMVAVFGIRGVSAFLTDADSADNMFTVGGSNIEIVEEFDPPDKLEPGTAFTKDVKAKNLGPSACYVRIKAVFTDSDMGKYCTVNWNTRDFAYNSEDGYYYYKKVLDVGKHTESLFSTITLSDSIPPGEIKDFDVLVYLESYQSNGFANYEAAWEHYHRNKPDISN